MMGMYTEFYFRGNVKDEPVLNWLDANINGGERFQEPYSKEPFFDSERWALVFIGGGAVYQESRPPILRLKGENGYDPYRNQLVIASSLKDYGDEIKQFVEWISPHLDMYEGDFLGYSLYEDSNDDNDIRRREHPTLYFHGRKPVQA
jgi:hypothetical protein